MKLHDDKGMRAYIKIGGKNMEMLLVENLRKLNQTLESNPTRDLSMSYYFKDETHYKILRLVFTIRTYIISLANEKFDKEYFNLCLFRLCDLFVDLMVSLVNKKTFLKSRKSKLQSFNKIEFADFIDCNEKLKSLETIKFIYNNPLLQFDKLSCIRIMNDMITILYTYIGVTIPRFKKELRTINQACDSLSEIINSLDYN